jgi:hypothetical protein
VRGKLPSPEEIVEAIVAIADDGYCRRRDLAPRFPRLGERGLRRAVRRAVALGLVLEQRAPDGTFQAAASSEGWALLRGEADPPRRLRREANG